MHTAAVLISKQVMSLTFPDYEEDTMSIAELGLVAAMLVGIGLIRFGIPIALTWTCCRVLRLINHTA
jgi:hypothetical protein